MLIFVPLSNELILQLWYQITTQLLMPNNEKTSAEVAAIAGKILKMDNPRLITDEFWEEIKSVAASALTQAPDNFPSVASYKKLVKMPQSKKTFNFNDLGKGIHDGFGK